IKASHQALIPLDVPKNRIYYLRKSAIFTAVASLFFWQWQLSSLAVGTSCASGNSITGTKFVRDLKYLAKEAAESLAKHKALELEIECLLRAVNVGNKMHKAFPLPVIEFPLAEEVPTTNEESCHCQKKREATAVKIALLSKSRRNCQSKSNDSYA
nr:hypothetical protein [Tanacetum cinerariifolium]